MGIVTLLCVGYFMTNQAYKNEWQLLKTPEKSVEIYFTDHANLPKKYLPGSAATISFTVTAHAITDKEYTYDIIQENVADGTITILKNGSMQIIDGRPHTQEVPIVYSEAGTRSKITIRLPKYDQAIHFWVEK